MPHATGFLLDSSSVGTAAYGIVLATLRGGLLPQSSLDAPSRQAQKCALKLCWVLLNPGKFQ